jgi:hypothetical protein
VHRVAGLLFVLAAAAPAFADRAGFTYTLGVGGSLMGASDDGERSTGEYLSTSFSLGGFVSPRASFSGRVEASLGQTGDGRASFALTLGPTAELWATERLVVGGGLSLLVLGIEPYDILINRGMALPLRVSLLPFADRGLRVTVGATPAVFRDRALLVSATLMLEWQGF